jgi:hypothetical protein
MNAIRTAYADIHVTKDDKCVVVSEGGTEEIPVEDLEDIANLYIKFCKTHFSPPTLGNLTEGEAFIFQWQHKMLGSFWTDMAKAISRADDINLSILALVFPEQVEAMKNYHNTPGWWENVCQKHKELR